jgi:hypothetical protein
MEEENPMADENPKQKSRGSGSRRRTPRDQSTETEAERPRSAPEVMMTAAEVARMRERLRRKFH